VMPRFRLVAFLFSSSCAKIMARRFGDLSDPLARNRRRSHQLGIDAALGGISRAPESQPDDQMRRQCECGGRDE